MTTDPLLADRLDALADAVAVTLEHHPANMDDVRWILLLSTDRDLVGAYDKGTPLHAVLADLEVHAVAIREQL